MCFKNKPRIFTWTLDGHKLEQVNQIKYLGVVFQQNAGRAAHMRMVADSAKCSVVAINRFFRTRGAGFIPAALKLYSAKVIPQLLYGIQLGPYANFDMLERIQSGFLRAIFGTTRCTSNVTLRMEAGLIKIESRAWLLIIYFWLRVHLRLVGLIPQFLSLNPQPQWCTVVSKKLAALGIDPEQLLELDLSNAKRIVKQRLADIELQNNQASLTEFYKGVRTRWDLSPANYLSHITLSKFRWAFTRARTNSFPSALLAGRYSGVPLEERYCRCGSGEIESIEHILLSCKLHRQPREHLILPLVCKQTDRSAEQLVKYLLSDKNVLNFNSVAKFCYIAFKMYNENL
ncbi:uncharacterized protein LOC128322711 [Hemicordylus capensis]|uniref:uncharacterized protein LOC128322711 n=1 Tax=Hemicordylus capensis TaxID=884348 RepID=UPI002302FA2E|nr:uncharacterized protein LOC128322711 [Hemicordylus capensis]XP_053100484.1 uncharacterized protein LOC128322711 [Hemicordylus capensis]XP_053100485.1 uncharacterized protein LOC128322711 [Hemicordylus capensis]XP_053100486.1 uncharacterized protein LOC128322711 [Hemicordylus capensis]XP_053100487.1 uncharacterized protein LOC128322711 [Hemicordylus capensis]XP_053100488.1 uncharacterized protein LOC128322711 [Hemicordylus capensis]XP_053100489.1 uncharacterized protein LOC128322711 [Hemico